MFFHHKIYSLKKDFVLFHFFYINVEKLGPFEIITCRIKIFVSDVYFDEVLKAFSGEIFIGVILETFLEINEGFIGVVFLFLYEALDPEEFGAFFTAILLYSIEIWLGLGVE